MAVGKPENVKAARAEARAEKQDIESILEVLKASGKFTDEQLDQFKTQMAAEGPSEDIYAQFEQAITALDQTPEGRARKQEIMARRATDRLSTKFAPFMQAGLALADIGTSIGQVRRSNELQRGLARPALPVPPGMDPELTNAIQQAQRGTMDAARVAAPARQELQDQYAKDLALAKSIGGGQAATLGALGQVASLRRARGAASLIPMIDSVRAREQGRLDGLLNARLNQRNMQFQQQLGNARLNLDQYDKDSAAAGALGASGRLNLRNSMQNLLGAVPGVAARVGNYGYNDKVSQHEAALNAALTGGPKIASPYSQVAAPIEDSTMNLFTTGRLPYPY
jgi:hypothetical protein